MYCRISPIICFSVFASSSAAEDTLGCASQRLRRTRETTKQRLLVILLAELYYRSCRCCNLCLLPVTLAGLLPKTSTRSRRPPGLADAGEAGLNRPATLEPMHGGEVPP